MAMDVYGLQSGSPEAARDRLEHADIAVCEARESLYRGDYFLCRTKAGDKLIVQKNLDPLDGEPAERGFPAYAVVVYVERASSRPEIGVALSGAGFEALKR